MKTMLILLAIISVSFSQDIGISKIVRVYDGDTFYANLYGVPSLFGDTIGIRLSGIDTPEMRGTPDCEKEMARASRDYLKKRLEGACKVELTNVVRGKYFRLVAVVWADGVNINQEMIEKGYAKAYTGKGSRPKHPCK